MMHILRVAAMLFMAWPFIACDRSLVEGLPELSVSIQIPEISATKAETGSVGATGNELIFSSLQLWVFIHGGDNDGQLVGYKGFSSAQLANTGLSHTTITRFGMPLTPAMFTLLSKEDTRVDVYALANAASATSEALGEGTNRNTLDGIVMSGATFGVSPLTMTVPYGLPMSGVLKGVSVSGSYPVLNISTVTLTRAVSKIRFVFCQQGTPATETERAVPDKSACVIKSITFGGTSTGHDCQIPESEKLFTERKYKETENLFDISENYTPFSTVIAGEGSVPLIKNEDISICEHPELLLFRSRGHATESAREYENRLDETLKAWPKSQVGPIYIRETDKLISGTIIYNTGGEDLEASFSMVAEDDNILSRNHSWILFAYFAEATKNLQLKIVVLPWDKHDENYDYKAQTVNVVRRFTIPENPTKFKKHQNVNGYYDIYFWHTLNDQPNVIRGDIIIATPVGQKIHVVPVPGAPEGRTPIADLFTVTPLVATIYPNGTRTEHCKVEYAITCNPGTHQDEELDGNYLDLHFCIEIGDNERWIDLDSESIDFYRIILKQDWQQGGE